jgi:hypothetical protein
MGWGKPNLVHNVKGKMSKAIIKDGMNGWAKTKHPNLALHKILAKHDDNWKTTLR